MSEPKSAHSQGLSGFATQWQHWRQDDNVSCLPKWHNSCTFVLFSYPTICIQNGLSPMSLLWMKPFCRWGGWENSVMEHLFPAKRCAVMAATQRWAQRSRDIILGLLLTFTPGQSPANVISLYIRITEHWITTVRIIALQEICCTMKLWCWLLSKREVKAGQF